MCSDEVFFFNEESIDRERILIDKHHILNEFFCPICCCLLWKPRSCASCQNLFCNKCIQTWIKTSSTICPLCRLSYEEKPAPPSVRSILAHFFIRCRNTSLGCTEILPYDLLEQHESINCKFLTKKCRVCEQIVQVKDIDQHKNICKPIVIQCPSCQCFVKIDLFEHHRNACLQQYSATYEELLGSLNFSNETILLPTIVGNFVGIEMFNQTREKSFLIRFWTMFQLMWMNLPMMHLILFNLFAWGCGNLMHALVISFTYVQVWIRTSMYQASIFIIIFSFISHCSLYFLLKSFNDAFIILFISFGLISWSSIHPKIQVNQFEMNFNFKELLLFFILIFLSFEIPLLIIRVYFDCISINIGTVCLALGILWYSKYFPSPMINCL
jgi:hypothetical protein